MLDFREILNQDVLNQESVVMSGEDFIIMDDPVIRPAGRFPYKNEWLIATLCENGAAGGTINLRHYRIGSGGFILILPGQVISESVLSPDFKGKILLMSRRFSDSLDIGRTLMLTASIGSRPYYQLGADAVEIVRSYIASCRAMIRFNGESGSILDVLRILSQAFFLGVKSMLVSGNDDTAFGPFSPLTESFLTLVEKEYRAHRQLDYYADRLGKNAKYLSRRVKEETGLNASDWIERCVILDAEAQLLSTKESILEIGYSLGFPSQSFFGKYFKRVTGLSPKEFRRR